MQVTYHHAHSEWQCRGTCAFTTLLGHTSFTNKYASRTVIFMLRKLAKYKSVMNAYYKLCAIRVKTPAYVSSRPSTATEYNKTFQLHKTRIKQKPREKWIRLSEWNDEHRVIQRCYGHLLLKHTARLWFREAEFRALRDLMMIIFLECSMRWWCFCILFQHWADKNVVFVVIIAVFNYLFNACFFFIFASFVFLCFSSLFSYVREKSAFSYYFFSRHAGISTKRLAEL